MAELTKEEVTALGHAVGLEIQDPELSEVTYSLNALLEALDAINPPGLESVEALPIILPPRYAAGALISPRRATGTMAGALVPQDGHSRVPLILAASWYASR